MSVFDEMGKAIVAHKEGGKPYGDRHRNYQKAGALMVAVHVASRKPTGEKEFLSLMELNAKLAEQLALGAADNDPSTFDQMLDDLRSGHGFGSH